MIAAELAEAVARTGGRLASCHRYGSSDWIAELRSLDGSPLASGCGVSPMEAAAAAISNHMESER